MTAEEKRADPRKSVNRTVSFELLVTEKDKLKNVQVEGLCSDISRHGLGLTTDRVLEQGNVLKLYLPVSELDTSLPLYAKVMWSRPADARFKAGLRFVA
ncbi:MAG: PilZ domain-containing protein [Deltaproteobacteria bacterium]|nr:PilZ domain-containing protein [Deltaproteobacteria bacterium]